LGHTPFSLYPRNFMPNAIQAALAYNGAVMVIFGTCALLLFPQQVQRIVGFKRQFTTKQLMIYRICGIWVALVGYASWTLAWHPPVGGTAGLELQRKACQALCAAHTVEVLVKVMSGSDSDDKNAGKINVFVNVFMNGHLALLLLLVSNDLLPVLVCSLVVVPVVVFGFLMFPHLGDPSISPWEQGKGLKQS
jgi:hypothetical protein